MSFYQRTWGRLWPGSAQVTPPCVILRPLLLVFVCVRKATFSGVLDERMMSCLQISALTTVSVCLLGSRETGQFQQSSPFFVFFFFTISKPEWKRKRMPPWNEGLSPSSLGPSSPPKESCLQFPCRRAFENHARARRKSHFLHTSASPLQSFTQVQIASRRMALLPRISVILPFPSWNAASFFKYTLHHGSCHRACCRPTHTCWDWPHGLFFSSSQGNRAGHLVHSNWIKVKFDRAYQEKQFGFPQGDIVGGPVGCICCGSAMTTLKKRGDDESRYQVFLLSEVKLLLFIWPSQGEKKLEMSNVIGWVYHSWMRLLCNSFVFDSEWNS